MNIKFYTLFFVHKEEKSRISGKKLNSEERILIYLRNCQTLNRSLQINGLPSLIVLTNNYTYISNIKAKYDLDIVIKEIEFNLNVPEKIGFYSAHYKIDTYKFFADCHNDYSFLLDNDMICTKSMPLFVKELIENHISMHYSFPTYKVYNHDINTMKELEPSIITGEWSGGEFIGGDAAFYKKLYNSISLFANKYFSNYNKMFHQGDEMLTSIAIEKMKLNGSIIVDGGNINIIKRYYSINEHNSISSYNSWFFHLICDKMFLSQIDIKKYNTNEYIVKKYTQYCHSTVIIKKIYHFFKS